jgi:hypothetical protein
MDALVEDPTLVVLCGGDVELHQRVVVRASYERLHHSPSTER